nr:uncharacterized protein LOC117866267 isoform X2 [Setaria viridis]
MAVGGETMMTREQLLHLFSRFSFLTSLPEVKQRIADAVRDKQEAVAVTTEIQEEILREMGIEMIREEMAIDEAELGPREMAEKLHAQRILQEQQLNMLVEMRKYSPESQSVILGTLRKQLEEANFDINASILSPDQIQEIIQK